MQFCARRNLAGSILGSSKVSAATPGAQRLYERAGFRVWGIEPAGARYNGQTVADFHMAFCLEPNIG